MWVRVQIQGAIRKGNSLTSRFSLKNTELKYLLFGKLLWWIVYKSLVDFHNPRHIWYLLLKHFWANSAFWKETVPEVSRWSPQIPPSWQLFEGKQLPFEGCPVPRPLSAWKDSSLFCELQKKVELCCRWQKEKCEDVPSTTPTVPCQSDVPIRLWSFFF